MQITSMFRNNVDYSRGYTTLGKHDLPSIIFPSVR